MGVFSKVWAVMILLLVVVEGIFLGADLASSDWKGATVDGILLAFWVFALIWFHFAALREQKLDMKLEQSKKNLDDAMEKMLSNLAHHAEERKFDTPHHRELSETFDRIIAEVAGDNPGAATAKQIATVKARFLKETGHNVKIEKHDFGLEVSISKEPAKKRPATKKAPVKKPVTKKKVTPKKGK